MSSRSGKVRLLIVRHGETDCNVQGIIQGQLDTDLNSVGRRQAEYVGAALSREYINEVFSSPLRRAKDTADAIVAAQPHQETGRIAYWVDDRLKERGFGSLEGKSFDRSKPKRDSIQGIEQMDVFVTRLSAFLTDVLSRPAPFVCDDEEQMNESEWVDERITRQTTLSRPVKISTTGKGDSSAQLNKGDSDRTILLVAHGAAISALVGTFLQDMGLAKLAAGIDRTRIWNCSITEVSVDMEQLPKREGAVDLQPLIKERSSRAFTIERWADVRHLPDAIDDAVDGKGNADEMVGKAAS